MGWDNEQWTAPGGITVRVTPGHEGRFYVTVALPAPPNGDMPWILTAGYESGDVGEIADDIGRFMTAWLEAGTLGVVSVARPRYRF